MLEIAALVSRWLLGNWKPVAVGLAVVAAFFWFRHTVHEADAAGFLRGYRLAQNEQAAAAQKVRDEAQAKIDAADHKANSERAKANAELETLRADLRNYRLRLSIRTVPAPGPAGQPGVCPVVDHGASRADIDPRDAEALVAIAGRGDDAIRALTAAQGVIRALTTRAGTSPPQ